MSLSNALLGPLCPASALPARSPPRLSPPSRVASPPPSALISPAQGAESLPGGHHRVPQGRVARERLPGLRSSATMPRALSSRVRGCGAGRTPSCVGLWVLLLVLLLTQVRPQIWEPDPCGAPSHPGQSHDSFRCLPTGACVRPGTPNLCVPELRLPKSFPSRGLGGKGR